VRLLTRQRLELDRAVAPGSRPRTHQLITDRIPVRRSREAPRLEPWQRVGLTLEGQDGRTDEELEADQRRDRVPGQTEHERASPHAERDRLARLDGHAPENLLHAELGLDRADEIVRADRDATGGDEHVMFQAALERLAVCVLVVGDSRQALDGSARRTELGVEDQSVGLVDLAWRERLAGPAKLGSRCQYGGARDRSALHLGQARGSERPELSWTEPRTSSDDLVSGAQVAALRSQVLAWFDGFADLDFVVTIDNILERDDGIGAFRDGAPGGDSHGLSRLQGLLRRPARRDSEDHGQHSGRVRRANGEPVHRAARKRRQVDHRAGRFGEHAARGSFERHRLRGQGHGSLEHEALGFIEGQELCHDRRIPYARRIGSAAVISVVVPVHDEERTVALLYDELESALQPLGQPWEAVFVDDGSTDGSYTALTRLHSAQQNVRVIRLRRNFGKAAALAAGFAHAEGDIVVTIDADLQDDPAEIPRLLAKLDEGFDLVSGWKTQRRDPLTRRAPSKIFNWVTGRVSGLRLHDLNCGLKAYRAEVVQGLRLYGELHRFIPVLAHYRGYRIAELPVNHRPREHGRSRYGVERYVRGFLDLLTVSFIGRYRYRPLHLFGGLGLALGAVGFGVLVYLTIDKVLGHAIGRRPLLILGVLLVVVGLQFFSLGLISELITNQHEERADARERTELHVDDVLS
jgi:glycosyltransferase involved in cell wall biosynthesis